MRICVIEDEEKLAKAISTGLTNIGYRADFFLDGEKALQFVRFHPNQYDLIILDLTLPGKDGFQICSSLRNENITTPILVLSAKMDVETKTDLLDKGADDYLSKPFSFMELTSRIRALLRRPIKALPIELRVAELTLNPATRKVFYKKTEIVLTQKEFSILEYLMHHPNQVITRDQLLDHSWDFGVESSSNVIDVHIKNLRKKLSIDTNEDFLETIRGIGYKLRV
ncbi:MAG TPA: response regulator transcription factor [Patescibacteria group bacterium]